MSTATSAQPASNATTPPAIDSFEILKEEHIVAPLEIVWETLLESVGTHFGQAMSNPMPMVLEPWVGGRWFRDLGDKTGHLWGHVQVIKPQRLLEICGPMMMSYAVASHVQWRMTAEGPTTKLAFRHTAVGLIAPDLKSGVTKGWGMFLDDVRQLAEKAASKR